MITRNTVVLSTLAAARGDGDPDEGEEGDEDRGQVEEAGDADHPGQHPHITHLTVAQVHSKVSEGEDQGEKEGEHQESSEAEIDFLVVDPTKIL